MGDRDDSPGPLRYRLWAGGLYKDVTEDEVRKKMERFGEVVDVRIRSSPRDTFAFVQFTSQKAIDNAIEKMDNSTSLGDRVRVAMATENTKKKCDEDGRRDRRCDSRGSGSSGSRMSTRRGRGNGRGGPRRSSLREDRRADSRRPERPDDARGDFRGGHRDDSRDERRVGFRRCHGDRDDPRGHDGRLRHRSRSRDGVVRMAGKVPVGRHKITIENLPEDMSWLELKDLGRDYGPSLTFARTYRQGNSYYGMLEFKDRGDADRVIGELNNRRVQGSKERLRAYYGAGPGGD